MSEMEMADVAVDLLSRLKFPQVWLKIVSYGSGRSGFAKNEILDVTGGSGSGISAVVSEDGHEADASITGHVHDSIQSLADQLRQLVDQQREGKTPAQALGPPASFKDPPVYFESTMGLEQPDAQCELLRTAATLSASEGLISAGDLSLNTSAVLIATSTGFRGYSRRTYCEFTMTARTSSGTGSGWTWQGGADSAQLNIEVAARHAIEIAKRSEAPVAIEPGRYTVILEPEAADDLIGAMVGTPTSNMSASYADRGAGPYGKAGGGNKIGHLIVDPRVRLVSDPNDPLLPFSPLDDSGWIVDRTVWIEKGVLKELMYSPLYGLEQHHAIVFNPLKARLEVDAPPQNLDQMIASTKRGIWVHRFGGTTVMDSSTLLTTGVTRDGTFLIEDGRVTKPIKNMRFMESPLFILNKLESAGAPVRSSRDMVCPRLKVHDFEFTSLSDAI